MTKQLLLEQFTECYDRNGWFVAVRNAIEGVSAAQADWKPIGADNSIWQTLSHLTFYNFAYLERFKGNAYEYGIEDNDESFTAGESDEAWASAVERFDAVMTEWRELISSSSDSKFNEPVSDTNKALWVTLIGEINAHNAYHAGQILLLRKLQGIWNPKQGVS